MIFVIEPTRSLKRSQSIAASLLFTALVLGALGWPVYTSDSVPKGTDTGAEIPAACRQLIKDPLGVSPPAELLLVNGEVVTMDDDKPRVRGVALRNGLIDKVGHVRPAPWPVVDLRGAAVLPGFIDSHSHWIGDRTLVRQWASQAIASALAQGWTSISELFVNEQRLSELCALQRNGDLRVKVGAFLPLNYGFERFGRPYEAFEPGEALGPHLFVQGVKLFADRAEDGLGRQTEPPDPIVQGTLFWEPNELAAAIHGAHEAGWQVAVHATGDAGLDLVLDAFEPLGRPAIADARHRVEHVSTVRDDQIARMAELGLIASVQHSWFHAGAAETLVRWVGRDRVRLTGRWRDLVDAGVPLAGSTDRPWALVGESGDSIDAIAFAVRRKGPNGKLPPAWMAAQRLSVRETLRSITIDAAFAQGTESSVGSIEPGKAADLVILSADPTRVAAEELREIRVLATIVDGLVEHCSPRAPLDLRPHCPTGD